MIGILTTSMSLPGQQTGAPGNHAVGPQSQYLARAAGQPVHWHAWESATFLLAQKSGRPILLDVGASWCKTCNIMDRDSYSDPVTAKFINDNFIPVRVDYDADPALSAHFEHAAAWLNLPAGLPLTAFVTPEGKLFDGGSFFPAKAIKDLPAFRDAMTKALTTFREHPEQTSAGLELRK